MALADEIAVKLGLNATEFKAALKSAGASVQEFKKQADPSSLGNAFDGISKKLINMKSLGGALAVALGINFQAIAESIARLWTGLSKMEEERLKGLVESTGKAADAQEKQLEKAKDAAAKRDEDRSKMIADQQKLVWDARQQYFENEKKWREDMSEMAQKAAASEIKNLQSLEAELAKLKFDALKPEEQLVQLKARQLELQKQMAIDAAAGADTTEFQVEIQKNLNQQKSIGEGITKATAKTEAEITAEKIKQLEIEKNKQASIAGIRGGNQFNDASDATLAEIARRNRSQAQSLGGGQSSIGRNMEAARLIAEAQNAEKELAFRRNFRGTVGLLGEQGARARFAGDPLQFDRVLESLTTQQDKTTGLLQSVDDRLATAGFGRRG